jgi:hypothetical protein
MREHLPIGVAHDEAGLDHFGKHKAAGSAASRASAPSGQQHGGKQPTPTVTLVDFQATACRD